MDSMWRLAVRDQAGFDDPKVSPVAFLGVIWAFTTFSFLLLPARLYARWTTLCRFFWDDYLVIFAWAVTLSITIATTVLRDVTYEVMAIGARKKEFSPSTPAITLRFIRLFNIVPMLLYVGLWAVKLAFLLFFRRLGVRTIQTLNRWWWLVFAICLVTFLVCFATLPYKCCFTNYAAIKSPECRTQELSFISLKVNCSLDVFTDCLIMTIPFLILRKTRISARQKVALSIVFSLVVITMVFAVARAALTTTRVSKQIDPTWMYMWSITELNVAIVIACIAPYRTFFLRSRVFTPEYQVPHLVQLQAAPKFGETVEGLPGSDPRIAPWTDEAHNIKAKEAIKAERPTLGVLPDDSGNWSEIGAPYILPRIDEEVHGHTEAQEVSSVL